MGLCSKSKLLARVDDREKVSMPTAVYDLITNYSRIILVDFGDDLSWDYLGYVRNHAIHWNVPTQILYGSNDNLQSIDTMNKFVQENGAGLIVMDGGERWFHTEEQMWFLDRWMQKLTSERRG